MLRNAWLNRFRRRGIAAVLALAAAGCRQGPDVREYRLVGQITAVDRSTNYVTVRHDDIVGFMPGMTMPFAVKNPALLEGRQPGDLVEATLHVQGTEAWIARMTKTGSAPVATPVTVPALKPGEQVPDLELTGQDGRPLALSDWLDGHVSAIAFTYTRCPLPDFCPAIDARFRALQQTAGDAGIRLLSVTLDPAFDTPPVLAAHARTLGARPDVWRFATTGEDGLAEFGGQFGLVVRKSGNTAVDIEHNLRTVLLDRDRRVVEILSGTTWTASALAGRLRAAASE